MEIMRGDIKEMGSAHNYLWCPVPGKGILKGRGKKELFYHVLQKPWEAICQYSVSLPAVLLLLFSPQLLEPSTWKEVLQFRLCVTRKQCICFQGNRSGTVKLRGSREHLCPSMDEEGPELSLVQTAQLHQHVCMRKPAGFCPNPLTS